MWLDPNNYLPPRGTNVIVLYDSTACLGHYREYVARLGEDGCWHGYPPDFDEGFILVGVKMWRER